jgi:uncharacterized membrane protein
MRGIGGRACGIAAAASVVYAVEAVIAHLRYGDESFDLAIAHHTIWQWSRFELPTNPIQGYASSLGDHFSPLYAVLAPIYWVVDSATTLLVAQALLLGLSIIPVYGFTRRRLDGAPALALTLGYALFWGIWAGNESGFHEYAFAPALLAFALDSADRRRWGWTFACLGLSLLVKEDMGLVVAAFGLYLLATGARRQGWFAIAIGSLAFAVVNAIVMPAFNHGGISSTFVSVYGNLGRTPAAAAAHLASHPVAALTTMTTPGKLHLLLLLFGAFAFLGLFSPVTLIALPGIAERLLAGPATYWVPQWHYTLLVAPLLAMGAADGLARVRNLIRPAVRRGATLGLAGGVLLLSVAGTLSGPPGELLDPDFYQRSAHDRAADAAVRMVPAAAPVAASTELLSRVSGRAQVYNLSPSGLKRASWLLVTGEETRRPDCRGWLEVFNRDGVAVLKHTQSRFAISGARPRGGSCRA